MSREFLTPLDLLSDVANCSLEVDSLDHSIIVSGSLIRLGISFTADNCPKPRRDIVRYGDGVGHLK